MQELAINKKKEYKGIDIMKFIMAIVVVASHTELYAGNDYLIRTIYDLIRACVVPFFFLTSGFFLYKENNQEEKLKIALKNIIKLYIMWNIIYFPLAIYDYIINNNSLIISILSYIRGFLFIGDHYLSWQLWYLLSFIYALIGILLLKKMKLKDSKILLFTFFIYLFGVTMTYLINNYNNYNLIHLFQTIFVNGRLFTGIFLIFAGMYIRKYNITLSKSISIILIIVSFVISVVFPNEISKVILFISIFLLTMQLNKIKINTINFRKCSTIFYFLHMWNLFVVLILAGHNLAYGICGFLINLLMCMVEAALILFIQNKSNFKFINELFNWPNK